MKYESHYNNKLYAATVLNRTIIFLSCIFIKVRPIFLPLFTSIYIDDKYFKRFQMDNKKSNKKIPC